MNNYGLDNDGETGNPFTQKEIYNTDGTPFDKQILIPLYTPKLEVSVHIPFFMN